MLNFKIVGCGAAGNKAAANLVKKGFNKDKVFFVNSTTVDLPEDIDNNNVIIFGKSGETKGGCGKERSIGKKMLLDDMRKDCSVFDNIIEQDDDAIVLVGSTEGGSGSASIPILAKYFYEVHKKPVICHLFFGFKDDVRGLQNTIEICQEMSENYTLIATDNSSFLDSCNGNRFKAEAAANEKFALIIKILMGFNIIYQGQVIDDTDLFKIVTTPGYMVVDGTTLPDRMKSTDDFNKAINNLLLYGNFIDPPKQAGCARIGTIFNLIEVDDNIDYSGKAIGDVFGQPYEYFISLADNPNHKNEFFYIASGMKFPIDKISAVYEEYKNRSKSRGTDKDNFFTSISEMKGNTDDAKYDMFSKQSQKPDLRSEKTDFFASFGVSDFTSDGKKVQTPVIDEEKTKDY